MSSKNLSAWIPTRPYELADAFNRMAAATGSVARAIGAANANYNGHRVTVCFNEFRKYWVAEYYWGQRVVLARGSLEECLRAAAREHARGALGSEVHVGVRDQQELELALSLGLGYVEHSQEAEAAHSATWRDDRFQEVGWALETRTEDLLMNARSAAHYREMWLERSRVRRAG